MSYQGWKNYETWLVALWIDNDQGLYEQRQDLVAAARASNVDDAAPEGESGDIIDRDAAISQLADSLQNWVETLRDEAGLPEGSIWSDMVSAALGEVDWHELATSWVDDE